MSNEASAHLIQPMEVDDSSPSPRPPSRPATSSWRILLPIIMWKHWLVRKRKSQQLRNLIYQTVFWTGIIALAKLTAPDTTYVERRAPWDEHAAFRRLLEVPTASHVNRTILVGRAAGVCEDDAYRLMNLTASLLTSQLDKYGYDIDVSSHVLHVESNAMLQAAMRTDFESYWCGLLVKRIDPTADVYDISIRFYSNEVPDTSAKVVSDPTQCRKYLKPLFAQQKGVHTTFTQCIALQYQRQGFLDIQTAVSRAAMRMSAAAAEDDHSNGSEASGEASSRSPSVSFSLVNGGRSSHESSDDADDWVVEDPAAGDATAVDDESERVTISYALDMFPQHALTISGLKLSGLQNFAPLYLILSFLTLFTYVVYDVVTEKENKLKEMMRMMGLSTPLFWLSWTLTYGVFNALLALIAVAVSYLSGVFGPRPSVLLLFLLFYLYAMSLVTFAFLVSVFFNKARGASVVGYFTSIVLNLVAIPINSVWRDSLGFASRVVLSSLSTVSFSMGTYDALTMSAQGGATFSNMFHPHTTVGLSVVMLLIDTLVYLLLAAYLDQVVPQDIGTTKPWHFPVTWWWARGGLCGRRREAREVREVTRQGGRGVAIEIMGLRKEFPATWRDRKKVAVDNLSLTLNTHEVFALLGHNGAGKSTTIHILTGLLQPTSGDATVFGLPLSTHMDDIRQHISVCPQENIFFEDLTVEEHLMFFAGLKGMSWQEGRREWERLVEKVQLGDKLKTMVTDLSGGQKRRLWVAIALMGSAKVVFLDEPTSGMDPLARRQVWQLIEEHKAQGRCVILTTHHMEEADLLADRKGVLSKGRLQCVGSSLFLKTTFGIGYYLEIQPSRPQQCSTDRLLGFVKRHVADATLMEGGAGAFRDGSPSPSTSPSRATNARSIASSPTSAQPPSYASARRRGDIVTFALPLAAADSFAALLKDLETNREELAIDDFGMSMSSLEEIFCKLGDQEDAIEAEASADQSPLAGADAHAQNGAQPPSSEDDASPTATNGGRRRGRGSDYQATMVRDEQDDDADGATSDASKEERAAEQRPKGDQGRPRGSWWQCFLALVDLRLAQIRNNKRLLFIEVYLPLLFVLCGMFMRRSSFLRDAGEQDSKWTPPALPVLDYGRVFNGTPIPYAVDPTIPATAQESLRGWLASTRLSNQFFALDVAPHENENADGNATREKDAIHAMQQYLWARSGSSDERDFHFYPSALVFEPSSQQSNATAPSSGNGVTVRVLWNPAVIHGVPSMLATLNEGWMRYQADTKRASNDRALWLLQLPRLSTRERRRLARMLAHPFRSAFSMRLWGNRRLVKRRMGATEGQQQGGGTEAPAPPSPTLSITSEPVPTPYVEISPRMLSFLLLVGIGLLLVPNGFAVQAVADRELGGKHSLFVAGLPIPLYWLGTWFVHYIIMLTIACAMLAMVASFRLDFFQGVALWVFAAGLLLYSSSTLFYAYVASFIFPTRDALMKYFPLLNHSLGVFPLMIVAVTQQFPGGQHVGHAMHVWVSFLSPPYTLLGLMLYLMLIGLEANFLNVQPTLVDYLEFDNYAAYPLLAMLVHNVALFVLLAVFEYRSYNRANTMMTTKAQHLLRFFQQTAAAATATATAAEREDAQVTDEDVTKEEADVARWVERFASPSPPRPEDHPPLILLHDLHHVYVPKITTSPPKWAVRGLSFSVGRGEVFGLLGPNGAGKTTTISLLTAQVRPPTAGGGYLGGHNIRTSISKAFPQLGVCPQFDACTRDITVVEQLRVFARIKGVPQRELEGRVSEALREMGILEDAHKVIHKCSGGTRRRLSVAIAFMGGPDIVILDEPSSGMDPQGRRRLWSAIQRLARCRTHPPAILLTTHSMEEADALCTRLGIMVNGRLHCLGSSLSIKGRYGQAYKLEIQGEEESDRGGGGGGEDGWFARVDGMVRAELSGEAVLKDRFGRRLLYEIPFSARARRGQLGGMFQVLQERKAALRIREYSLSQPTLEQVFIRFANRQQQLEQQDVTFAQPPSMWTRMTGGGGGSSVAPVAVQPQ
ncbi:unnamed protein product [Vitrella brassicaformis CCMP3155]|uniref:ABC transporter domain-containing protein n=3 Tax=Vitrella brassicaformis TaxID=1169539 RepID=A0A0G4FY09_VITBC|nr:unnamed protein product [Vitrella brassicaformis CCMP3155]|eukprot:CEM20220.1 unnamed protein product [Vitrella brassicaformis CCMP3155]